MTPRKLRMYFVTFQVEYAFPFDSPPSMSIHSSDVNFSIFLVRLAIKLYRSVKTITPITRNPYCSLVSRKRLTADLTETAAVMA